MSRPDKFPQWAENLQTDPITGAENKLEPTAEFKLDGLQRLEPLPRAFLNYMFDLLNQWVVHLDSSMSGSVVAVDQDTTPEVNGYSTVVLSNTVATTITDFDTSELDKELVIVATNNNTTIQSNANIILDGSTNITLNTNDVLTLRKIADVGDFWIEVGRSIK